MPAKPPSLQSQWMARLAERAGCDYIASVKWLTKQEQLVLTVVIGLLLTGWAVRTYRTAHPPVAARQPAQP